MPYKNEEKWGRITTEQLYKSGKPFFILKVEEKNTLSQGTYLKAYLRVPWAKNPYKVWAIMEPYMQKFVQKEKPYGKNALPVRVVAKHTRFGDIPVLEYP